MGVELAKTMTQSLQHLPHEFAHLSQRMGGRNPLFWTDVREQHALIPKPSTHPNPPAESTGKSESLSIRSGQIFQQTARAEIHADTTIGDDHNLILSTSSCVSRSFVRS